MKLFTKISREFFVLTLLSLFIANSSFADAWVKQRARCTWLEKRWKAHAHLKYCGNVFWLNSDSDAGCETVFASAFADPYNDGGMTASAWREKKYITGGPFDGTFWYEVGTFVPSVSGICGGYNDLYFPSDLSFFPIIETKEKSNNSVRLTANDVVFDYQKRVIVVKGIKGYLAIASPDFANDFTAFTISVTNEPETFITPEGEAEEENSYLNNLVWSARALLNNGKLLLDDNFDFNHFSVNSEQSVKDNSVRVDLAMDELVISIPEGFDLDNLVLNLGSDAGNLGYGISKKFRITDNERSIIVKTENIPSDLFQFDNFPNPVSKDLNIQVQLEESVDHAVINLYDMDGNIIKQIYNGALNAKTLVRFREDVSLLKPRNVYFVKLITKDKVLIRKILIE